MKVTVEQIKENYRNSETVTRADLESIFREYKETMDILKNK